MNSKKFIGGGFPGIKECIDEKNIITKESREKREFSVRKLIPINQILSKNNKQFDQFDQFDKLFNTNNQFNYENISEEFNIIDNVKYNSINSFLHELDDSHTINVNKNFDINLINAPIKRQSKANSKAKTRSKRLSKKYN